MDEHEELKDVQLKVMVSASQKRLWERSAKAARRNLSDWIRIQLDDAAEHAQAKSADKDSKKKN